MPVIPHAKSNKTPPFLMVGDSLVAGFDWQSRLPDFEVVNLGVPGLTTAGLLSSLPAIQRECPDAELVLVMIGTNDFLMGNYEFPSDLKKIVVGLSRAYPAAEMMVNSLMPLQCHHDEQKLLKINQTIANICMETASCYVDIYDRFEQSGRQLFETDGVHLSDTGYKLWTRTLLEHVAFLLEND